MINIEIEEALLIQVLLVQYAALECRAKQLELEVERIFDNAREAIVQERERARNELNALRSKCCASESRHILKLKRELLVEADLAVAMAIGQGKIQGIKQLRSITGWGLKECKDWIEARLELIDATTTA